MNPLPAFREAAVSQLEGDILSFGWLRQMAELDFGYPAGAESVRAVFDVVQALVESGVSVVGNARNDGERVVIQPWPERNEALRMKLTRTVDAASSEDRDWVFWIQLVKHYNRK